MVKLNCLIFRINLSEGDIRMVWLNLYGPPPFGSSDMNKDELGKLLYPITIVPYDIICLHRLKMKNKFIKGYSPTGLEKESFHIHIGII